VRVFNVHIQETSYQSYLESERERKGFMIQTTKGEAVVAFDDIPPLAKVKLLGDQLSGALAIPNQVNLLALYQVIFYLHSVHSTVHAK
jgi:hypothetical protein